MRVMLSGYIDVPIPELSAVETALEEHITQTLAEPGCLSFDVTPHPEIEGRFVVRETFTDDAAFDHHQSRTKASVWADVTRNCERNYEISRQASDL